MRRFRCRVRSTALICLALPLIQGCISPGPPAPPAGEKATAARLLVLNKHDDNLMVIEDPSHRRIATIPVGDEPHEVVVTPDGLKAYVSNVGSRSITIIDLLTNRPVRTLRPERADFLHGMAITSDGRYLVLTSEGSHRLYLIDTARDVILRGITSTQEGMHMIAIPPSGKRAYVANRGSGTVSIVDIKKLSVVRHVDVGPGPEGIAATPDGSLILVALRRADEMVALKTRSGSIVMRIPAGRTPIRVAVTPDSRRSLISNRESNDVTVIDLESEEVQATIPVGQSPGGLVIDPNGELAFICNNASNTVSIISIPQLAVIGEIPVGAHPDGIAYVPAAGTGDGGDTSRRRSRHERSQA